MKLANLKDLYIHELKDLYSAETQLLQALPKMAEAASSADLKEAFEAHLEETQEHVTRLEQVLELAGANTKGPKCKGMEGLLNEGNNMIEEDAEPDVLDAGLIAAAQKVEHYEIAGYGTVKAYAELLNDEEAVDLLSQTLEEEEAADEKLTAISMELIEGLADDLEEEEDAAAGD